MNVGYFVTHWGKGSYGCLFLSGRAKFLPPKTHFTLLSVFSIVVLL